MIFGGTGGESAATAFRGTRTVECLGLPATILHGTGDAVIQGTSHADVIFGGAGDDVIRAGGGNDRICSRGGNDRVAGGAGSDRIDAGPGADFIDGGLGSDVISGASGSDTLLGRRGNDELDGGSGAADFVDGALGDDAVSGGPGDGDQVLGGVGNDDLSGGPGRGDVLSGGRGRDKFHGGSGPDDVASFAAAGTTGANHFGGTGVQVDLEAGRALGDGTDQLRGIEDVIGTPFRDSISGDGSKNVFYGGGAADQLVGSGVGDVAYGGGGSDTCRGFSVEESCGPELTTAGSTFEVDLSDGAAAGTLAGVVRMSEPEMIDPDSHTVAVSIRVSYEPGAWLVEEGPLPIAPADDCFVMTASLARCALSGKPSAVFLDGGPESDSIEVTPTVPAYVSTLLDGEGGADLLVGGSGSDVITGAPGASDHPVDLLRGKGGEDILANGLDLRGGGGSDLLIGQPCAEQRLGGGTGVDSVSFARFIARRGVEARIGGSAQVLDPLGDGGPRGVSCFPGETASHIGLSVERLEGSRGDDVLNGDGAANTLLGRAGDDRLLGRGGGDILVGGNGKNWLQGGSGFDRLYAADQMRDHLIDCGDLAGRQGVAKVDPQDPKPRHCARAR